MQYDRTAIVFPSACPPSSALFDRLAGADGADEAHQTLMGDLERLLNTRNGLKVEAFLQGDASVLDWGLPDLLACSADSSDGAQGLARVIAHALHLYEPRLVQVKVVPCVGASKPGVAGVLISAQVRTAGGLQRVEFDLTPGAAGSLSVREA